MSRFTESPFFFMIGFGLILGVILGFLYLIVRSLLEKALQ